MEQLHCCTAQSKFGGVFDPVVVNVIPDEVTQSERRRGDGDDIVFHLPITASPRGTWIAKAGDSHAQAASTARYGGRGHCEGEIHVLRRPDAGDRLLNHELLPTGANQCIGEHAVVIEVNPGVEIGNGSRVVQHGDGDSNRST